MYYLVKNPAFGSHLLVFEPEAPDVVLHSFTYGNDCQHDFEQSKPDSCKHDFVAGKELTA
jgi:hypothetical protein